ncbi:MAG: methyl-accepting chemotaxis protein [Idiomarina sp.]|nr:methyl-accepting chemotaxis protein [Idiomarina sp.]
MLRNIKVGVRATLFFALMGLLVLVVGVVALVQQNRMAAQEELITQYAAPALQATGNIEAAMLRVRLHTVNVITASDAQTSADYEQRLATSRQGLEEAMATYRSYILTEQGRAGLQEFEGMAQRYWQTDERVRQLARTEGSAAAILMHYEQLQPVIDQMIQSIRGMSAFQQQRMETAATTADSIRNQAQWVTLLIIAIAVVLVAVLAMLFTRSIVTPIRQAVKHAEVIAEGDLTHAIDVTGNDEATQLLAALNRMQDNLRNSIATIADSAQQLASTSEELSSVTEDSTRGLHQQSAELEQAATAVNEMTAAVEEVARNAQDAAEESVNADEQAQYGREQVGTTVSNIENLVSELNHSARNIENLAAKVKDITSVLDVIGGIAEQTNLLALNAAIEAARAGESGRGFAVVADEVRALAHRTQTSTKEIEQMVSAVQQSSADSVKGMQISSDQAKKTQEVAKAAGDALQTIAQAVSKISERNASIASAAEEQAQVAKDVDKNLVNIQDLSSQTASGANQTSASSQELARLAVNLNELVASFKI